MDKSGSVHVHLGIWSMIKDDSSSTKLLSSQWPIYLTCISHLHGKLMSKSSVPYCKGVFRIIKYHYVIYLADLNSYLAVLFVCLFWLYFDLFFLDTIWSERVQIRINNCLLFVHVRFHTPSRHMPLKSLQRLDVQRCEKNLWGMLMFVTLGLLTCWL